MSVKKSFSIFLIIVAVSIAGVLFFSIDASTFAMLDSANLALLGAAVAFVVLMWLLDALKFKVLALAAGEKLSLRCTLAVVWINYFGSAITPMQSGGGPFQIYLLYRNGVSLGKSVAITLVRTFQVILLLALAVPFSMLADPDILQRYSYLRWYACYVGLFIAGAAALIVISIARPGWIKHWVNAALIWINKIGLLKSEYLLRTARRINREISAYNENIKLFTSTGKWWFALSILLAAAHLITYMSIMPCLILAAGFTVNYLQCILAESLFLFMLYFIPTPGASGAAEGGAVAIFGLFVPWSMAGVMAVTWRALSEYTGTAIGTFIIIKMLGWGGADKVLSEENNIKKADAVNESKQKDKFGGF